MTGTYLSIRTRRINIIDEGVEKSYIYDGGDCVQERSNAGSLTKQFIRGTGLGGGIGSILYKDEPSADREYFLYNVIGSTVATTNPDASVKSTSLYEAFGKVVASTGTSDNNRLFCTKERSASIGLDNFGFRYFDWEIGRFIQRDPAGYPDGLNNYLYCSNNPINHIDPLGLEMPWYDSALFNGTNALAGFADSLTMGATSLARELTGIEGVNHNSKSYAVGETGETLAGMINPIAIAKTGTKIVIKKVGKEVVSTGEKKLVRKAEKETIEQTEKTTAKQTENAPKPKPEDKPAIKKEKDGDSITGKPEEKGNGPYSNLEDSPYVGEGKSFTRTQKKKILEENKNKNDGKLRDDKTGEELVVPQKSEKGVTPPSNEANIDHVYPKSEGGTNSYSNAEVRSRENNLKKGNKIEGN